MGEEFLESEVVFPDKDDGTTTNPDRFSEDDETSMIIIRSNGQQMQGHQQPQHHHHDRRHNLGLGRNIIKKSKSSSSTSTISRSLPVIIPAAAAQYDQTKVRCYNSIDNGHYCHNDIYESDDDHFYDVVVPPHLIVARRIAAKSASSLLAQNGRPLRGRDLCQVRNSILRLTGFLQT